MDIYLTWILARQAVRRRFDKRIYIPLPDLKARQHMFKVHLGDTPHNLSEKDFEDLARKTDGFSGSDVAVAVSDGPNILLCKNACFLSIYMVNKDIQNQ
jgi:SpoVK/Ycf46/Vps4 family AAA+-type ATPase